MFMQAATIYARPTGMRWAGVVTAIIAATVDVLYLGVITTQGAGDPEFLRVPFVAAFIALMAICAALSARASAARWQPLLLGVSAAGLLLLGYFAIFSIGLPLLVAGLVASGGLVNSLSHVWLSGERSGKTAAGGMAAGGAVIAVVLLLGGFSLTELAIRCPANGTMSGGGSGFLGGSYQYSCDNGKLTFSR
jgi:hypothetical protein